MEAHMSTQASSGTVADGARRTGTLPALKRFWQRGQRGWPERSPLLQFPNTPLLVAMAGLAVATVTDGSAHDYAQATFYAALGAWAWLELTSGLNPTRRIAGAAGLVFVVVKVGRALAA
jgi:hypothetical protein